MPVRHRFVLIMRNAIKEEEIAKKQESTASFSLPRAEPNGNAGVSIWFVSCVIQGFLVFLMFWKEVRSLCKKGDVMMLQGK